MGSTDQSARDDQEAARNSRKRRHQPEPDGEHKGGGETEDQRRPVGDASPLDDEGQIFFFVYDMIVAHKASFLSDAAGTGLHAERLGPDHGDQHAAEQGEDEVPRAEGTKRSQNGPGSADAHELGVVAGKFVLHLLHLVRADGSEGAPAKRHEGHGPYGIGESDAGHGVLAEGNAHGLRAETGRHHLVHGRADERQPHPRTGPAQGNQQGDHRTEHGQRRAEGGDGVALAPFNCSRVRPISRLEV